MKHYLRLNLICLLPMISTLTKMEKILATIIQKQVNLILIYTNQCWGVGTFFSGSWLRLPLKKAYRLWLPMITPAPHNFFTSPGSCSF